MEISGRQRDLHAENAEALIHALDEIAFDSEVRTWLYVSLLQRFQGRLLGAQVKSRLEKLPPELSDRVPFAMLRAWAAEIAASPRNLDALTAPQRRTLLEEASGHYARAVARAEARPGESLIPGDAEDARLRYARVLQLQGRTSEAETLLLRVRAQAERAETRYLAALFLGVIATDEDRPVDARRVLDDAVDIRDTAPSARIASSYAAFRAGDRTAARSLFIEAAAGCTPASCETDPWCQYDLGDAIRPAQAMLRLLESRRSPR